MSKDSFPIMKNNSLIHLLHKSRSVFCQSVLTSCLSFAPSLCAEGICLRPLSLSPLQLPREMRLLFGAEMGLGRSGAALWLGWGWADGWLWAVKRGEEHLGGRNSMSKGAAAGGRAGLTRRALACPRSGCTAWTCGAPTRPRARRSSASL